MKTKTRKRSASPVTEESIKKAKIDDKRFFLIKAEPNPRFEKGVDVKFSIDDLQRVGSEHWDGVRNYEARNILRDRMRVGDLAFFYHSNCKLPGIAGVARIVKAGYVDFTAFDTTHPYYDPKSKKSDPRWFMVDVEYVRHFKRFVSLKEMQSFKDADLKEMPLIKRGRLSVQTLSADEWEFILGLEATDS